MYRVSPFTYLTSAMLSTGLANNEVRCADNEYLKFDPLPSLTCEEYTTDYIKLSGGGYVQNPNATSQCSYCALNSTNQFLATVSASYENRWRDFGIMWAFIVFNVFAALFFYWLGRVPKGKGKKKDE